VRKLRLRKGSWIVIPALILGFFSAPVEAENTYGLTLTVYNNFGYNGSPPLPAISGRPSVGQMNVSRVQQDFDQNPPFQMYEDFIVHYEGFITSPVSGNFRLWPQADDGTKLYINDLLVQNDWRDKGGGGALSSVISFEAGVSKKFEMWFYENGGGAWTTLYWDIGNGWEVVPDSAFTTESVPTTTTTLAPYLNTPQNLQVTGVTDSSVSLSWDAPEQSNVDVERYAIMWSCENNWDAAWGIASYTNEVTVNGIESATECMFQVRADNDTIAVYSNWSQSVNGITETTTTSTTTTSTTTSSTTTLPDEPEPEVTTTTEAPEITVPEEEVPTTTEPPADNTDQTVEDIVANAETTEELTKAVDDAIANASGADEIGNLVSNLLEQPLSDEQFGAVIDSVFNEDLSTEELSAALDAVFQEPLSDEKFAEVIDAVLDTPLSDEQFAEVVDVLESDSVSEDQVEQAVDKILELGVTEDQATELATSAKVLESIDTDQAAEIFQEIAVENLTAEEESALVESLTNAPTEIKETFEEEIDIFGEGLDEYVPTGSQIDVKARRALIAVTTTLTTLTTVPMPSGGAPSAPSGSPSGGGGPSGDGGSGEDRQSRRSRRK
jgi:hypothetical protein